MDAIDVPKGAGGGPVEAGVARWLVPALDGPRGGVGLTVGVDSLGPRVFVAWLLASGVVETVVSGCDVPASDVDWEAAPCSELGGPAVAVGNVVASQDPSEKEDGEGLAWPVVEAGVVKVVPSVGEELSTSGEESKIGLADDLVILVVPYIVVASCDALETEDGEGLEGSKLEGGLTGAVVVANPDDGKLASVPGCLGALVEGVPTTLVEGSWVADERGRAEVGIVW